MATDLFSRIYVPETQGKDDDPRMRKRLSSQAKAFNSKADVALTFKQYIESELGIHADTYPFDSFFGKAAVRDVLDGITLFGRAVSSYSVRYTESWFAFSERVMRELGMRYRVGSDGIVHFYIDQAFQAGGAAAVASLGAPRYAAAAASIQTAIDQLNLLDGSPKTAIREVFAGVESLFKVALETNSNLGERELAATLAPRIDQIFAQADTVQKGAASQIVQSMKDWANASHKYRHGHGLPEPAEPTREIAIALVGMGTTFARFLAQTIPQPPETKTAP